jgi:hypothetical protein
MRTRRIMQQALAVCAISCLGLAMPAKASSTCTEVLANLVITIDSELEKIPSGPVERLEKYARARLPITGCSPDEFKKSFERSRYLSDVTENKESYLVVLVNKSVAVAISMKKHSSIIDGFLASVRY